MVRMIYHRHDGDYEGARYSLNDLLPTCKDAVEDIRPHLGKFDSIVAQGMSGVVVAVPVALKLGVPVVIVRKAEEHSYCHDSNRLIGRDELGNRSLWIDDFVSNGDTRRRVRDTVEQMGGKVVASYLYHGREYSEES